MPEPPKFADLGVWQLAVYSAVLILVLTFVYLFFHEWTPALPDHVPEDIKDKPSYAGTAAAVEAAVGLIVTISLALSA
jgi:hypothetical protein